MICRLFPIRTHNLPCPPRSNWQRTLFGGNGLTRPVQSTAKQEQAGNDRRGPARDMQAFSVLTLRQQILL